MKTRTVLLTSIAAILVLATGTFAQGSIFSISAGYLHTKDTKGGMFAGASIGTAIDEAVDIGIGFDLFHKTYSDETQVAKEDQVGMTSETYVTEVEYTRTILPLMVILNIKIPVSRYFGYFIRGGLGYEFLFSKERNFKENITQTRKFGNIGWQGAGGFYYQVGRRSTLLFNVMYNSCEVRRDIEKSNKGLPVSQRVDISGLGFRLGVLIDVR